MSFPKNIADQLHRLPYNFPANEHIQKLHIRCGEKQEFLEDDFKSLSNAIQFIRATDPNWEDICRRLEMLSYRYKLFLKIKRVGETIKFPTNVTEKLKNELAKDAEALESDEKINERAINDRLKKLKTYHDFCEKFFNGKEPSFTIKERTEIVLKNYGQFFAVIDDDIAADLIKNHALLDFESAALIFKEPDLIKWLKVDDFVEIVKKHEQQFLDYYRNNLAARFALNNNLNFIKQGVSLETLSIRSDFKEIYDKLIKRDDDSCKEDTFIKKYKLDGVPAENAAKLFLYRSYCDTEKLVDFEKDLKSNKELLFGYAKDDYAAAKWFFASKVLSKVFSKQQLAEIFYAHCTSLCEDLKKGPETNARAYINTSLSAVGGENYTLEQLINEMTETKFKNSQTLQSCIHLLQNDMPELTKNMKDYKIS